MGLAIRLSLLCFASLCASCAGARTGGPAPAASRDCPLARDVRRAEWMEPEADEVAAGLRPGWAIPVGYREVAEGVGAAGVLDRPALQSLGGSVVPDTVWVLRAGEAPCVARIEGYVARVVEDGLRNLRLSAFTADCAGARRDSWVSFTDPGACRLSLATELGAERLTSEGRVPAEPAPVPAVYAPSVPPDDCEVPCDVELWQVRVARGAPDVAEVWVTSLSPDPPDEPCNWIWSSHAALHVPDGSGAMRALDWPFVVDRGYGVPLTLDAILVDRSGTRVVLLTDHAYSAAYELRPDGMLGEGARVEHYLPHEEDGVFRSLAPYCGP